MAAPRTMCHAAILDAGSSGTRIYIYGWRSWRNDDPSPPQIEELFNWKMAGGISRLIPDNEVTGFAGSSQANIEAAIQNRVQTYLDTVFQEGHTFCTNNHITIANVPLYFLATAGMRQLRDAHATFYKALLACIDAHTRTSSGFNAKECGSITGEAEALYGWIAANYSLGFFSGYGMRVSQTVGYVELGGASAQIAYRLVGNADTDPARSLSVAEREWRKAEGAVRTATKYTQGGPNPALVTAASAADAIYRARLTLVGNDRSGGLDDYKGRLAKVKIGVLEFDLFLASYAAGIDVAIREYDTHILSAPADHGAVKDPSKHIGWSKTRATAPTTINGSANFDEVKAIISQLRPAFDYPENEKPDVNIVRSPNRSFVGGASFWYNTRGVFGLDSHGRPRKNRFSFKQYNNEVKQSFNRDFATAKAYRPTVGVKYLVESGFTAAWVQHVLLQCFGFKGDDPAVTHEDKLSFRPYNGSAEAELSWTLGRVVLLAVGDSKPQQMTGPQARAYNELSAELARRDAVRFGFEEERHAATTDLRGAQKLREVKAIELDMRDSNGLKKKAEEKLAGLRREIRTTTQGDANRFFRLL